MIKSRARLRRARPLVIWEPSLWLRKAHDRNVANKSNATLKLANFDLVELAKSWRAKSPGAREKRRASACSVTCNAAAHRRRWTGFWRRALELRLCNWPTKATSGQW